MEGDLEWVLSKERQPVGIYMKLNDRKAASTPNEHKCLQCEAFTALL